MELQDISKDQIGYLCGLFRGDGYSHYDPKQGHYTVEFHLNSRKDLDIIHYLTNMLCRIGLNPSEYKDKRCRCKRIRVRSKALFEFMESSPERGQPSEEFKLGYVSGMIDAEGYVHLGNSTITFNNTDKDLIERCRRFLEEVGITPTVHQRTKSRKDKKPSYRVIVPVEFKKLSHLSRKIKRGH